MSVRRASLAMIVTLAVIALAWWILYIPYQPDRVFAAIPADATITMVQTNLAAECDRLTSNSIISDILTLAGAKPSDVTAFKTNAVAHQWMTRLASDQTVLAYMPSVGSGGQPGLVFASWIGNRSRLLRWQAAFINSRDFRRIKLDKGRLTVWLVKTDLEKSGLRLSLALSDGLILGCLSPDPLAVRSILETAEGYPGRLSTAMAGLPAQAHNLMPAPRSMWGWSLIKGHITAYDMDLSEKSFSMDLVSTTSLPPTPTLQDNPALKPVNSMIATTSDLLALMPLSWLGMWLPADPPQLWLQMIRNLTSTNTLPTGALGFIAVLDKDHNGRLRGPMGPTLRAFIKGLKTPTLLIGLQVGSEKEAQTRIDAAINQLNSQYNFSLTASHTQDPGKPELTLISETRKNFYGMFEPGERIAMTMVDNWLVLASNASILDKILTSPASPPHDIQAVADAPLPSAIFRINLENIGGTLKNLTGIMKLASMANSGDNTQLTRERLDKAGQWSDILKSWREARITMSQSSGNMRTHVTFEKR